MLVDCTAIYIVNSNNPIFSSLDSDLGIISVFTVQQYNIFAQIFYNILYQLASCFFIKVSYLNTVIASRYPPVLNFNIRRRMGEFTLGVWSSALLSLRLPADLQLQPPRVLLVEEAAHVEHRDGLGVDVRAVGHAGRCCHGLPLNLVWLNNLEFQINKWHLSFPNVPLVNLLKSNVWRPFRKQARQDGFTIWQVLKEFLEKFSIVVFFPKV